MFTGIIEEVGTIRSISKGGRSCILTVAADIVTQDTRIGDSIALNGVCLTVTKLRGNLYDCDVMAETLRRSNLGQLRAGSRVNLERALAVGSRLGGHIVSGHIDGTGVIRDKTREDNAMWFTIETTPKILRYIVEKGSIAIDGISLTVVEVGRDYFKISMIPHTAEATELYEKQVGSVVNLENDLVGKYVEKLLLGGRLEEGSQVPGTGSAQAGAARLQASGAGNPQGDMQGCGSMQDPRAGQAQRRQDEPLNEDFLSRCGFL